MTEIEFEKEVIQKSYEKPVVVDFWASWCGPCRTLGPVIEQLALEQSARWDLVKVNTEDSSTIAKTYQIMSIPNVKLFYQGKPIAEFSGALPRQHILKWLEEHIPSPALKLLHQILEAEADQSVETTIQQLEDYIEVHPTIKEARVVLSEYVLYESPMKALSLIENIKLGDDFYERAEDLRVIANLMIRELSATSSVETSLDQARTALKHGLLEPGINHLIEAVGYDKHFANDLPRRSVVALFRIWGSQHELTKKYRRRFDMMLY